MLPDGRLSTTPVLSPVMGGRIGAIGTENMDTEDGGIALQDGSSGMLYQVWEGTVIRNNDDNDEITLTAPNQEDPTIIYTGYHITDLSFTFDTNMRPAATFKENGVLKLLWYDPTIPGQVVQNFSFGSSALVFLDEKRPRQTGVSDILAFYIRYQHLCVRQQRDRYGIEYIVQPDVGHRKLITIGMGTNLRLQIIMTGLKGD